MNRPNYQKQLDILLEGLDKTRPPALMLHSCCAPCSSYVIKYLREFFKLTVFYYNPNITMEEEYRKRAQEQKRLIKAYNEEAARGQAPGAYPVAVVEANYAPETFLELTGNYAGEPEGGERCFLCYELRMRETAREAVKRGCDYFCTTLSVSPLKNADKINEIGQKLEKELGIKWLPSDFKKRDGYRQSVELSHIYGLYRQNYCGCAYSRAERERRKGGGENGEQLCLEKSHRRFETL